MKPALQLEAPITERTGVSLGVVWALFGAFTVGAGLIFAMNSKIDDVRADQKFDRAVIRSIAQQVGAKIPDEGK